MPENHLEHIRLDTMFVNIVIVVICFYLFIYIREIYQRQIGSSVNGHVGEERYQKHVY